MFRTRCLKQAVRGVDMQLQLGRITALLGHNGAGKSTLVSIITGWLRVVHTQFVDKLCCLPCKPPATS